MWGSRQLPALALALAAVALAACGGDDGAGADREEAGSASAGGSPLEHTHGLGVSDRDGTLFVATHNGLYQVRRGSRKVEPVGDTRKDVMGFSILSPGRFLGSGHPGPGEELPPLLGLIESRDQGRTWRSVSLLGQVDFHVLRSAGRQVYGVDSTSGRFLVSRDGGRNWTQRETPAPVFDLAPDPDEPSRLIAASERGLFGSSSGGRSWRPLSLRGEVTGLLAWPGASDLYVADPSGQVQHSDDGGRSFEATGQIGGQPAAFIAHGQELYAALPDGTIKGSTDRGASWSLRASP